MARICRLLAILIAVAGAVDPAITSNQRVKPDVAIVAGSGPGDDALADRVARELSSSFTVVRGPFAGAAAVVSAGDRVPGSAALFESPAFAVVPEPTASHVTIEHVIAPARLHVHARAALTVDVRARQAAGRRVTVTVRQGAVAVDESTFDAASADETRRIALTIAPAAVGVTPLEIVAAIDGTPASDAASVAVDVRSDRRAVLVFDGRPSWMSTFVRRALEADPRFVVTSRVVTSREASIDRGAPPPAALDLASLSLFDAVVVGAPDALSTRDVAGLDAFLRDRGGAVVLLLDESPGDRPFARLLDVRKWEHAELESPKALTAAADLSVTEIAWPAALPPGAAVLASADQRPAIWRTPTGPGRLVVSGALDAWRARDASSLAFDRFWRSLVADAAMATPPIADVTLTPPLIEPGARTQISVTLAPGRAPAGDDPLIATLGDTRVRLRPGERAGHFTGTLRGPDTAGTYPIRVSGQGYDASASLVVATRPAAASAIDRDLLAAWTSSLGGQVVPESQLSSLIPAISRVLAPPIRSETWYLMRSAWWILPFTLALGFEWLMRRRSGLR